MNMYAIRMGDWVEVRLSSRAPRVVKSTAEIKAKKWRRNIETNRFRLERVDHKLESTIFEGGSVLGCVGLRLFYTHTGLVPTKDKAIKILPKLKDTMKLLLENQL